MIVSQEDYLMHEGRSKLDGAPVGSGRYPLGSGDNPYQDYRSFKSRVTYFKRKYPGIKEKELIKYLFGDDSDVSIRDYRKMITKAKAEIDAEDYRRALMLKNERQWSYKAIAEELGRSETGVRQLLQRDADVKAKKINNTVEMLRESLDSQGGFIDIGVGSELYIGVSRTSLDAAIKELEAEGYSLVKIPVRQLFGQGNTTVKVICPPGTTKGDVYNELEKIRLPIDIHIDGEGNKVPLRPIQNVDSKRIKINYAEDGGINKDGVIELRRGVSDLDLGNSHYAQVRIGVDGTHYLKGMAVYADDLPDGIDIRFNTNKKRGTPMIASEPGGKEVLKPMQDPKNELNPFGAAIRAGGQRGALNIVNEEGNWRDWSKTLSSQFLSKQYPQLAKKQLKLTGDIAEAEFEEIKSLTNPTLKRYFLQQFANSCDSDAVHLKAAALPRQAQKVLLPVPELNADECYAPTFKNGEQVALVRYPHGGTFEIPVLTVNNKGKGGKVAEKVMGNAQDAIGIHPRKAEQLSGADFDGDTVMVIPLSSAKIKYRSPLKALDGFDPKIAYNGDHLDAKDKMKKGSVQTEMGKISNLITDMTIQNANDADLAKAVKHSMVVIDAYKHGLDYKASARDNDIAELKKKYLPTGGASTVVSQAKSQAWIDDRREKAVSKLTPSERKRWEQGEIIWEPTGKKTYKGDPVRHKSTKMYEAKDANALSSGTVIEQYYADYANRMKSLANAARAEMRSTGKLEYSPSARKTYSDEVSSLNAKLKTALMNAPKERKAQALANATFRVESDEHPEYDEGQKKKAKSRHLEAARSAVGAGKQNIDITDNEWSAIQAGAVHDSTVLKILENTDSKELRSRALPKANSISDAKLAKAKSMLNSGYQWGEIAEMLGVSVSGLQKALD